MKNKIEKKRLVVIGSGMAATSCVEEIIGLDPERFEITVFGAEEHLNYNRVLLSHVLTGEKELKDIVLHDLKWYEDNNIKLHSGKRITEINRAQKKVISEDASEHPYDVLILATGSLPFIPPVVGMDKEGVVAFRTINDCEKIKDDVREGSRVAVIGGGLLGLEAAYGALKLGADVSVVHLADRLLERQLDITSAEFLKEDIEKLGIDVMLSKETTEVYGEGKCEGLNFKDGTSLEADLIIVSVGIKPNIELIESSGIYCEKGVVVSDVMQSYDPAVYAIGECVQHRNKTFGLVAPIFKQAKVLANHLAGDGRLAFKDIASSARLKVPDIELYSAGSIDDADGIETVEYLDRGARVYKKLFLKDNKLNGMIMYGDTSDGPRLFAKLLDGSDVNTVRHTSIFGDGAGAGVSSMAELTDETIVCGCNGITKGMIVESIKSKGLFSREDVTRETGAGGGCGGCGELIEQILESTLGSDFNSAIHNEGICPCTRYTRDDIVKNIREQGLKSVTEVMDLLGWETVGCEKCRPAINYYVSMVDPLHAVDDISSRLVNERTHANIQADGTFSVVPRMYGGVVSAEELKRIAEAAVKYDVPLVKVTGGQRIDLLGVKKDDLPKMWKDIDMPSGFAYAKGLRTVKTCVGEKYCRYGTQDSLGLGVRMERFFEGLWMPAKVKMAVTGCPRNCAESLIKDLGVVGINGGFEIYVGGSGGIVLKGGKLLCTVETSEEVLQTAASFMQFYREDAEYGERTYKWVRRVGLEVIKDTLAKDGVGLAERLNDARDVVKEPWGVGVKASGE